MQGTRANPAVPRTEVENPGRKMCVVDSTHSSSTESCSMFRNSWRTLANKRPASSSGRKPSRSRRYHPTAELLEVRCLLSAATERFVTGIYPDLLDRPVDPSG